MGSEGVDGRAESLQVLLVEEWPGGLHVAPHQQLGRGCYCYYGDQGQGCCCCLLAGSHHYLPAPQEGMSEGL